MPHTLQQPAPGRLQRVAAPLATLAVTGVAWAGVALLQPGDAGPVPCPWREMTGLDCPFCGATRSAAALANGDLVQALDRNAFFVLAVIPLVAVGWLVWTRRAWRGRPAPQVPDRVLLGLLALVGVWWALRLAVPWLGSSAG